MIIGAPIVVSSKNVEGDHAFFRVGLKMPAGVAGGGYMIFGVPASEQTQVTTTPIAGQR